MAFFYQTCVVISLLQGISLPFVIVGFRSLSRRHRQAIANLKSELQADRGRKTKTEISQLIHDHVPKFQPLKCNSCGAGVLLRGSTTLCPHCKAEGSLPEDYAAAMSLRGEVKQLLKSAVRHWRVASILTLPLTTGLLISLGVIEFLLALLLPAIVNTMGSTPNTMADYLITWLGTPLNGLVYLCWFSGIFIWTLIFLCLAVTAFELRKKLPIVPVFEKQRRVSETATCHSCNGAVEYSHDDFACICDYCNVENFRVRFTRLKRAEGEAQKTQTNFALFGAMGIIENYVTLVYAGTLLLFGFPLMLVVLGIMIYTAATGAYLISISSCLVLGLIFVVARSVFLEERVPER